MQLLNNNSPVVNHQYTYDVQNRLASVGNGTHAAHYTRLDGSGLLSNTAIKTSGGTTLLSTDRAYDAYYRMTSIASTAGATNRSYAYTYNDKDQRIKVDINKVGLASNAPPRQVASWEYGYDDKGQVTSAVAKDADGLEIPGYGFGYDYDGIGNRKYEKRGMPEMRFNYTSNSVNQYTQIITPGVVPFVGEADETAEVKALRTDEVPVTSGKQSITATRNGKYFSGAFTGINNALSAININYNVYAIIDDTANDKQLVRREPRQYLLPKAVQPLTYDPDGNMLTMPQGAEIWNLTWNGENRLIAAESATCRLEFTYDYMGRRVRKQVYTGSSGNWTLASESKYVYDGWNCIAIFNASDVLQKSYLWGEDLSGSLQGAGGVGGLLAVTDATATYFPMYDGNGNIMTYVDASGTVQADYTYDPFGRTLSQSGDSAAELIYRFSSKPLDTETELYYYGYRYYSPGMGRWLNCDVLEEAGGMNIYGMVGNNPISQWDYLGMSFLEDMATKMLKNQVDKVDKLYRAGKFDEVATEGRKLYELIAAGGAAKGLTMASMLMQRWLSKEGGVYTMNDSQLSRIFGNVAVRDWLIRRLWDLKGMADGKYFNDKLIREIRSSYKNGMEVPDRDVHYSMGEFSVKFTGRYCFAKHKYKREVRIDGTFEIIDKYDWQNPGDKDVELSTGIFVNDKWATEVENKRLAKAFDITGKITYSSEIFKQNKPFSYLK